MSTDGRALAHAWVVLMVPGEVRRNRAVRADDGGRYLLPGLAGGSVVTASKPGYAGSETGDQVPTGLGSNLPITDATSLSVADDESRSVTLRFH